MNLPEYLSDKDLLSMDDMVKINVITDYHILESLFRLDFYAQLPNDFDDLQLSMYDLCKNVADKVRLNKKYSSIYRKIWNGLTRKEEYQTLEEFVDDFIQVRFDILYAEQDLIGYGEGYVITREGKRYFYQLHNSMRIIQREEEFEEHQNMAMGHKATPCRRRASIDLWSQGLHIPLQLIGFHAPCIKYI